MDIFVLVFNFQDGGFVTRAVAVFAGELDVGEELHLDGDGAVALAGVAAAAGDVEGEGAGAEAVALGVGLGGEEGADVVEGLDVGDWIRARGAADGGLVDEDDVVEVLRAGERAVEVGWLGRGGAGLAVERLHERAVEDLVDERGFAAAADAGDAAEEVEGDLDIDAAQVVEADAGELEALRGRARGDGAGRGW